MKPIRLGIDILVQEQQSLLAGRQIGLVSNAASTGQNLTPAVDLLQAAAGEQLSALFAPEHGFFTAAAAGVDIPQMIDRRTGLPIHSLYGETKMPTAEMLADLDLLIFDIQTIGVRFFTYTTTLLYVMQAAAAQQVAVIVSDRPNPIGGALIEGPVLQSGFESFVGGSPLPIRPGMTIGELATLYQKVWAIDCDLTVVGCQGWQRSMWFDETGLVWVPPSPNIPKLETAILYPGICLIEGTNLSEGRGTTLPFEVVGAPGIDGWALAQELNAQQIEGVTFRAVQFSPAASKWQDQLCEGVQLHVTQRQQLRPVTVGLQLIATIKALHPEIFAWNEAHFDRLMGGTQTRQQLVAGVPVAEIVAGWTESRAKFEQQRQQVLLY